MRKSPKLGKRDRPVITGTPGGESRSGAVIAEPFSIVGRSVDVLIAVANGPRLVTIR